MSKILLRWHVGRSREIGFFVSESLHLVMGVACLFHIYFLLHWITYVCCRHLRMLFHIWLHEQFCWRRLCCSQSAIL